MRKTALALLALALVTPAALAQTPLTFTQVDTDGDGLLSFAELKAVWPDLTQEEFDAADSDGKGGLTPDEVDGLQPSTLPAPAAQ